MSEIKTIFKDEEGRKRGIFLAVPFEDGTVRIGYSVCSVDLDNFNSHFGTQIARNRAFVGINKQPRDIVKNAYPYFLNRCRRYYKDKKVIGMVKKNSSYSIEPKRKRVTLEK